MGFHCPKVCRLLAATIDLLISFLTLQLPMPEQPKSEILAENLSNHLDFHTRQLEPTFPDVLEALAVNVACAIHNNARTNKPAVLAAFKEGLDKILASLENDEAVELN